jgi:hypothetical protein
VGLGYHRDAVRLPFQEGSLPLSTLRATVLDMRAKMFFAATAMLALAACNNDLKVTGIEPASGIAGGGEEVVIQGGGFQPGRGGVTVQFGSHAAQPAVVASSDKIQVTTPGGEKNTTVDVLVTFDDGKTFKVPSGFHYIESGIDRKMMNNALNQMGGNKK